MGAASTYLYGDSTPSPLKTDFVAFLRDAFDFAVEALLCDARLTDATRRVALLSEAIEKEIGRAEAFAVQVSRTLDHAEVGDRDSLAARCAARIRQGAMDLVRSEAEAARASVATEKARAMQAATGERDACAKALGTLLLRHPLPEALAITHVSVEAGTHYGAQLHGRTAYGLEWVLALEVPPSSPLAHVLRIERVAPRLEVEAPEEGGWIHKEVKIRPQRFDRLYLAELTVDPAETTIKLRAAPEGGGAGFDLSFKADDNHVQLVRVLEGGAAPDSSYSVVGEDVSKLQSLRDTLVAMASELAEHRKALIEASLDQVPIRQLESPRALVERLIVNIAPTVQEIAKRSLTPGELVLKRLLGDNLREELFISKTELREKLDPLPMLLRHVFDPLTLWESPAAPEPAGSGAGLPAKTTKATYPSAPAPPQRAEADAQVTPQLVQLVSSIPPPDGPTAPQAPTLEPSQASSSSKRSSPPRP
jgi:hypothetical protein